MLMAEKYARTVLVLAVGSLQLSLCDQRASEENDLAAGSQLAIVEEPRSVTLAPGAASELRCEVFGTPVPTIQWLHNGKVVRMGDKPYLPLNSDSPVAAERLSNRGMRTFQMAAVSSKISIPCAEANRAGLYTCIASNGRETITANATVRVEEKGNALWQTFRCPRKRSKQTLLRSPAEIYTWTEARMERPGVSVQLMCRASGSPKPKINWYETSGNGAVGETQSRNLIEADDERFMLLANGDLLVKKTAGGSPMSMYHCEATNEFGKNEVAVMVLQILDDTSKEKQGAEKEAEQETVDEPKKPAFAFVKAKMSD